MKSKIQKFSLLCLIYFFLVLQTWAQQELTLNKLVGTYVAGHSYGGSSITLESDGRYTIENGSHDHTGSRETGTYIFSGGLLRFTITRYFIRREDEETEINLLDPKEVKKLYDENKIIKEFSLKPIKWSDRIYLIYEGFLIYFVNAINLGLEPRDELTGNNAAAFFYLREGDEQKKVRGRPLIPAKWQSYLLSKPVTAKIISIKTQGSERIATINKGKRHGLKVGMKLVMKGQQEPTLYSQHGVILTVKDRTATVRVEDRYESVKYEVGTILFSKYAP